MAFFTYPGGYCTKRCIGSAACGGANRCAFFLGFAGELENLCFKGCTASADCRVGYSCVNFGTTAQPFAICYPLRFDGSSPGYADAGPPRTTEAGAACTSDAECRPPDTGTCAPATWPDGGAGFPGGQCSADCSLNTSGEFCGQYGACEPVITRDSRGPFISWTCHRGCSTDGSNPAPDGGAWPACRSGYRCVQGNLSDICVP